MENAASEITVQNSNKPSRKYRKPFLTGSSIFVFVMLLYPVAHFILMWIGVNINSILLTFQSPVQGKLQFVGWDDLFFNYKVLFESFEMKSVQSMFRASASYFILSCFITLPISLIFSYFIFKKIAGNGFFKIIFFIPSILPLIVLTLVFTISLSSDGALGPMLSSMGIKVADLFIDKSAQVMIWIFCLWAGIGYNVILLTSGMSRIPRDILESCKMDGVSPMREFFKIIVPLSWPTITTLFVLGMMSMFSVFMQPMFLTQGNYDTMTIGLQIYQQSRGSGLHTPATLGLFCSLVGAPVIMTVRWLLNKKYQDVSF